MTHEEKYMVPKKEGDSLSCSSRDSESSTGSRGNWAGKCDFMLSCIGYAVGLGNIWRFPYLCYRNGGAVFLIPYLFFLVVCGMPLVFLEMSFGQFASLSPITIWKISPLFKGVGYGMVLISGIVCIYYNIIIAWTLYYLFKSFAAEVPWKTCDNPWNSPQCALSKRNKSEVNATMSSVCPSAIWQNCTQTDEGMAGLASYSGSNASDFSWHQVNCSNITYYCQQALNATLAVASEKKKQPSEEFWENHVLEITDGIHDMGGMRWPLFGCLALAWVIVFLCLCRGIKSSGRVVYVTAIFPYVVLIILCIRGATLPGAMEGVKFYVIPKWEKLLNLEVWGEAAMQIFYSQGASWGAIITMASYNKFNHNCYRDARIVPVLNCGTSIFAGFVIFSILGYMAHISGSKIDDVVKQGPGLVFVVYPEAVANLPISPLWAILFFLMLFTIGLDSQFGMFETMTSAFVDEFPQYLRKKKTLMTAGMCLFEFLIGIICVTKGGIYFLQIMDWYSSTFSLMVMSFCECLVIGWVYGADRFYDDIRLMIGYTPCLWWKICWRFITPFAILSVFLYSIISHKPVSYGETYSYPGWAVAIGWVFALCSILPLPIIAIYKLMKEKGPAKKRLIKLLKPTPDWGPALESDRRKYEQMLSKSNPVTVNPKEEEMCCLRKAKSEGMVNA